MVELIGDERLDYLLAEDMKIIQSPSVFSFSLDAVLLAKFVYVPIQKGNLLDLCQWKWSYSFVFKFKDKRNHYRSRNSRAVV